MSDEDKKRIEQEAYDYAMIEENAPVWGDPELAVFRAAKAAYIAGAEAEHERLKNVSLNNSSP